MADLLASQARTEVSVDETELRRQLLDWILRYDQTIQPQLDREALCSPTWERIWNSACSEYDALEQKRVEQGIETQFWQPLFEKIRNLGNLALKMKSESHVLTSRDWAEVSLARVLQKYLGVPIEDEGMGAALALEKWSRLRELMAKDPHFRRALSVSQATSYNILTHWWSNTYQDPRLSQVFIAALEAARSSAYHDKEAFRNGRKSFYNSVMYRLFSFEFIDDNLSPYLKHNSLVELRKFRKVALRHATAQRLAYTSCKSMQGFSINTNDPYTSSMDGPCPWLDKEKDRAEMPYFLWDVDQRCTKTVNELGSRPDYCCVSHTWGRWRKDAVRIPGVPWPVPGNEKFDVECLPYHLQRLRPTVRYIWIDLFCIPQDGSPKANEEIKRQALIFQNSTRCVAWLNDVERWDNTYKALDWLGIAYLHSTTDPGIYDTEPLLKSLSFEADARTEFFIPLCNLPQDTKKITKILRRSYVKETTVRIDAQTLGEPTTWFSSLWTLQEAMFCPDLTFVNRDWMPLEDRAGTSIPLQTLFFFIDTVNKFWLGGNPYVPFTTGSIDSWKAHCLTETAMESRQDPPEGPRQLILLGQVTKIAVVLEWPSQLGILLLAPSRQSTGSRAPAIMSALGVTDWYQSDTKTQNNLVFNSYPLPFVKETAAKLGARFYWGVAGKRRLPGKWDMFRHPDRGSMLPFTNKIGFHSPANGIPANYSFNPKEHPAVATWKITQSGSVVIRQVGILASSETPKFLSEVPIWIETAPVLFSEWVKGFPKEVVTYAISLWRDPSSQTGLILQGYRKPWFSTQRLAKVNVFFTMEPIELPPTTNVDWLVW